MAFTRKILLLGISLLCLLACSKRNYNVDAEATIDAPAEKSRFNFLKKNSGEVALADTAKPTLAVVVDSSTLKDAQKKKKKQKKTKKEFLGFKVKKGFTKTGNGKNAVIETFYYLPTYQEPNPYAPAKYYFNTRRKRILRASTIRPKEARILHGPYKRMIGKNVVMEGYFYVGTRHLRWETYRQNSNKENILVNKIYYEKGFPRDAIIKYYDAGKTKLKEVIPYAEGKLNGEYVMFREDGLMAWQGQYENGKKVGVWIEFWPFRNRKHFEYQYPETADVTPFEPYLLREYDRHSTLIFERGKLDKRPPQ